MLQTKQLLEGLTTIIHPLTEL